MVETQTFVIEAKLVIRIPLDIIHNKQRTEDVKEGIKKAMTKGLYEEGIGFEIKNLTQSNIINQKPLSSKRYSRKTLVKRETTQFISLGKVHSRTSRQSPRNWQ